MIDKLAAPYKKLFTKVKQLRQRLEKVMNTDHIDLTELSKVRENLEFFEKKLQETREKKLQKKLELEKAHAETVSTPKVDSQPETTPSEQPTDIQPETVTDAGSVDVTPDVNTTSDTVPVEAATEKEADTTVFAYNSMVEPTKGMPGSYGKVIHHDASNDEVYVEWQNGSLKDRDGFGAYSASDLKMRASKEKKAEGDALNGYIGYYRGKQFETHAKTSYEAQQNIAREHNIKKAYEITIVLAEKGGEQATHNPQDVVGSKRIYKRRLISNLMTAIKKVARNPDFSLSSQADDDLGSAYRKLVDFKLGIDSFEEIPNSFQPVYEQIMKAMGAVGDAREDTNQLREMTRRLSTLVQQSKKAELIRDPDLELRKGTKFVLARSVMTKGGFILPEGTEGVVTGIIGDHIQFISNNEKYVLNKFDALKLNKIASKKKAEMSFRDVPESEKEEFKQWARENATPEHFSKSELYHPLVREEWNKMGVDWQKHASKKKAMWKDRLQDVYDGDFEAFKAASDTYGLADRLGFSGPEGAEEAWEVNPTVQGSTNPADYKRVASKKAELIHSDTCDTCGTKQRYPGQCNMCRKNKELGTYRKEQAMQLSDFDKKADVGHTPYTPLNNESNDTEMDLDFDPELEELKWEMTPEEPAEDDIVIVSEGPLGAATVAYQGGKEIARMKGDYDEFEKQIRAHMKATNFYPDVWTQDDHGGIQLTPIIAQQAFRIIKKADHRDDQYAPDPVEMAQDIMREPTNRPDYIVNYPDFVEEARVDSNKPMMSVEMRGGDAGVVWFFTPNGANAYGSKEFNSEEEFNQIMEQHKGEDLTLQASKRAFVLPQKVETSGTCRHCKKENVPIYLGICDSCTNDMYSKNDSDKDALQLSQFDKTAIDNPMTELDEFTRGYLEAALWATMDNMDEQGGEPLDSNYGIIDIRDEFINKAIEDGKEFLAKANALYGQGEHGGLDVDYEASQLGHDFWLTRHHHGAGFWDGDYEKELGDKLTELSHKFGEVYLSTADIKNPVTHVTDDTVEDLLEETPTLDVNKKRDQLLDQLNTETDPAKKEQIKKQIDNLKYASKKKASDNLEDELLQIKNMSREELIAEYSEKFSSLVDFNQETWAIKDDLKHAFSRPAPKNPYGDYIDASKKKANHLENQTPDQLNALIDNWMDKLNDLSDPKTIQLMRDKIKEIQSIIKKKTASKKKAYDEVTPPHEGDPNENGIGYGGDRPGVWVSPKHDKDVSLESDIDKEGGDLNVANRKWPFEPVWNLEGDTQQIVEYKIYDDTGQHIMTINPKGKQLNKAELENIVFNELGKHDLVTASDKGKMVLISDLIKDAKIVKRKDGYHVVSESGKNLGGPYDSKAKAQDRLQQVEYFKHKEGNEEHMMNFPKREHKPIQPHKFRPPTEDEKERVEKQYEEMKHKRKRKPLHDEGDVQKEAEPQPKPATPASPGFKWVLMEDGTWVEMESGNTPGAY